MRRLGRRLRPQAVHCPGERDGFPDVVYPADPTHGSLEPQTKARVHERSVLPEIQIPAVGRHGQSFLVDAREELVVVVLPLRPTDDLAVTFWREAVVAEHG